VGGWAGEFSLPPMRQSKTKMITYLPDRKAGPIKKARGYLKMPYLGNQHQMNPGPNKEDKSS